MEQPPLLQSIFCVHASKTAHALGLIRNCLSTADWTRPQGVKAPLPGELPRWKLSSSRCLHQGSAVHHTLSISLPELRPECRCTYLRRPLPSVANRRGILWCPDSPSRIQGLQLGCTQRPRVRQRPLSELYSRRIDGPHALQGHGCSCRALRVAVMTVTTRPQGL